MADKITYPDKILDQSSSKATNKLWRFGDANEVKNVVNQHADELDNLSGGITDAANGINNNNGVAELGTNPITKNTTLESTTNKSINIKTTIDDGGDITESEVSTSSSDAFISRIDKQFGEDVITKFRCADTNSSQTATDNNSGVTASFVASIAGSKKGALSRDTDGADTAELLVNRNGSTFSSSLGLGFKYSNRATDEANVPAWGSLGSESHLGSEWRLIQNLEPIATPQVAVSETPQAITTAFKSTTQNVFGVGALCVFNVTTGCLKVGQKFGVNIGDSDGMSFVAGAGTHVVGTITGSTSVFDTVMIERVPDGSFNLTGEVYKVM